MSKKSDIPKSNTKRNVFLASILILGLILCRFIYDVYWVGPKEQYIRDISLYQYDNLGADGLVDEKKLKIAIEKQLKERELYKEFRFHHERAKFKDIEYCDGRLQFIIYFDDFCDLRALVIDRKQRDRRRFFYLRE
jgi:hypothetical protein